MQSRASDAAHSDTTPDRRDVIPISLNKSDSELNAVQQHQQLMRAMTPSFQTTTTTTDGSSMMAPTSDVALNERLERDVDYCASLGQPMHDVR